jgi:hypothetical protein
MEISDMLGKNLLLLASMTGMYFTIKNKINMVLTHSPFLSFPGSMHMKQISTSKISLSGLRSFQSSLSALLQPEE